jgi:hypothetical protein
MDDDKGDDSSGGDMLHDDTDDGNICDVREGPF